ncbi:unnamed protein product [Blepharisma stoltei]|uniref:FYVE-type domain-containing protein n=1 Tax=Blepharisma stoltei TaxID=1481888 RepID=A0AAU9JSF0_9CILI|nr:unnamed protein product [Blepharisma stoltei]
MEAKLVRQDSSKQVVSIDVDLNGIIQHEDRDHYKKDKLCTVCATQFGRIGIVHAKKHFCKFCYRGVCAKCSSQQIHHPEYKEPKRICNKCFQKVLAIHSSTSAQEEVKRVLGDMSSAEEQLRNLIIEKENEKANREEWERKVAAKLEEREKLTQSEAELEELKKQLEDLNLQNLELNKRIVELEGEKKNLREKEIEHENENYTEEEYERLIKTKLDEIETETVEGNRLKKMIEEYRSLLKQCNFEDLDKEYDEVKEKIEKESEEIKKLEELISKQNTKREN